MNSILKEGALKEIIQSLEINFFTNLLKMSPQ